MPLSTALRALRDRGFDAVELMIGDPLRFDGDSFRAETRAHGLEISQICTGELYGSYSLSLNDPDPDLREAALRKAEAVLGMAARWRCPVGIGRFRGRVWEDGRDASLGRMTESLMRLDKMAAAEGVDVLLEPLRQDVCDTMNSVAEVTDFIRTGGLRSCGWLLDTDHVDLGQSERVRHEAGLLGFVHLADSKHVALGHGNIRFGEYIDLLASAGYQGYCSIEVFPNAGQADGDLLAEMSMRLSEYLRRAERLDIK
jgi:D-psicose/D-tagatose/L-ribulose 3-epimerase